MRKYLRSIVLVLFIMIAITTIYIQKAVSQNDNYPNFVLQKIAGDESVVKNLNISGTLYLDHLSKQINLTKDGIEYVNHNKTKGTREILYGYFNKDMKIEQLKKDYRSFMRGKYITTIQLSEDETRLATASINFDDWDYSEIINQAELAVEILNKSNKKVEKFNIPLENIKKLNYLDVNAVELHGKELKVFVLKSLNDYRSNVVTVYTIDLDGKKITNEQEMLKVDSDKEFELSDSTIVKPLNPITKQEAVVYQVTWYPNTEEEDVDFEEDQIDTSLTKYFVYDLKSGKTEELNLPVPKDAGVRARAIDGTKVYYAYYKGKGLTIDLYDLKKQKVVGSYVLDYNALVDGFRIEKLDDHIVVTSLSIDNTQFKEDKQSFVVVLDGETLKELYHGELIQRDHLFKGEYYNLSFESDYY